MTKIESEQNKKIFAKNFNYYLVKNGKTQTANWAGVVLQGFGEGCGCEEGGDDIVFLPFVCGSYFLKDKVEYQKGTRTQSINVLRGGAASIDLLLE